MTTTEREAVWAEKDLAEAGDCFCPTWWNDSLMGQTRAQSLGQGRKPLTELAEASLGFGPGSWVGRHPGKDAWFRCFSEQSGDMVSWGSVETP